MLSLNSPSGKSAPRRGLPWLEVLSSLARGRAPGQAVIQYTDRCNASCAQCGMRKQNKFERCKLDPEKAALLVRELASCGVKAISFTGGEPLLYLDEILSLAALARQCGIASVRSGTNGFIFMGADKSGFEARILDTAGRLRQSGFNAFWISLDSADPATHEKNRGLSGMVEGLRRGLPLFHAKGLYPAANLGLNRYLGGPEALAAFEGESFEDYCERVRLGLRSFFSFAKRLGFTSANVCYPMRSEGPEGYSPVYAAATADECMNFTRFESLALFTALHDVVGEFRGKLRIFTPQSSLLAMRGQGRGYPCLGGKDFVFIDAKSMRAFPCGYRGGEPLELSRLKLGAKQAGKGCELCDWECFRDPSHTFGPLLDFFSSPGQALGRLWRDPAWARTWFRDLRYYRACGWFDATLAPDFAKLSRF